VNIAAAAAVLRRGTGRWRDSELGEALRRIVELEEQLSALVDEHGPLLTSSRPYLERARRHLVGYAERSDGAGGIVYSSVRAPGP
jgi:hypothetical protein